MTILSYPTKKVILAYTLLGGMSGGALIALWLIPTVIAFDTNFLELAKGFITWVIIGLVIGFFPALTTGFIISRKHLRLINLKNYLTIAFLGFFASFPFLFICMISISFWINGFNQVNLNFETLVWSMTFSLPGAISAVIIGKLVLPKT